MANVSSGVTAGVTFSAATIQPIVQWGLMGFHAPAPEVLPGLITAAVLSIGHYVINRFFSKPTGGQS